VSADGSDVGLAWKVCGWVGQACFVSRFFVQWALSERAKRVVTPRVFWWLSLFGAVLLIGYTLQRGEPVLLFGYAITGAIYLRNLWVSGAKRARSTLGPLPAMALAALACAALLISGAHDPKAGFGDSTAWMLVAFVGQGLWSTRFLVQWYCTERTGESHFPVAFWWFSLGGNALLLAYAIFLGDPVYIAGFVPGPIVQVRNLMLASRSRAEPSGAGSQSSES
jgi:lipid-A-disaccharide synthase-like uncharacterized protein